MSLSCQRGDPCPVLLKFELSAFNLSLSSSVNYNNSNSCILYNGHLSSTNGLGIQDAACRAGHSETIQGTT
jgi:hypothetical protein